MVFGMKFQQSNQLTLSDVKLSLMRVSTDGLLESSSKFLFHNFILDFHLIKILSFAYRQGVGCQPEINPTGKTKGFD